MRATSNLYAEQNLLSALLCEPERAVSAAAPLSDSAFSDPLCAKLFLLITAAYRAGKPVDSATLTASPALSDWDPSVIGGFLRGLYEANRPAAHVPEYVEIIAEAARLREAAELGESLRRDAMNGMAESHDLLTRTADAFAELRTRYGSMDLHTTDARTLIRRAIEEAEARAVLDGPPGITTGLKDLDDMIGGWQPGDLVTIGGRASMGKSVALQNFALSACQAGLKVLYFSTEMRAVQTMGRFICNAAEIDTGHWKSGRLSEAERIRLEACEFYADSMRLKINDKPDASPSFIYDTAQRVRDGWGGLDLLVVDYLQRLSPDTKTRQSDRRLEVGQMARALKNSAQRLNLPVLTASQVGRSVERREDKRPMLSDLMESGDIEAESDVVGFLYRPAYYGAKMKIEADRTLTREERTALFSADQETEIIIAKQRNGPTGTVKALFEPRYVRLSDLSEGGF